VTGMACGSYAMAGSAHCSGHQPAEAVAS
jgi:hypothetical protein